MYHWMVAVFLAKCIKHPFWTEISCAQNLSNPLQTVGVDRKYIQALRTICFIKKYEILQRLLTSQKCIIGWWFIISWWMTVGIGTRRFTMDGS